MLLNGLRSTAQKGGCGSHATGACKHKSQRPGSGAAVVAHALETQLHHQPWRCCAFMLTPSVSRHNITSKLTKAPSECYCPTTPSLSLLVSPSTPPPPTPPTPGERPQLLPRPPVHHLSGLTRAADSGSALHACPHQPRSKLHQLPLTPSHHLPRWTHHQHWGSSRCRSDGHSSRGSSA